MRLARRILLLFFLFWLTGCDIPFQSHSGSPETETAAVANRGPDQTESPFPTTPPTETTAPRLLVDPFRENPYVAEMMAQVDSQQLYAYAGGLSGEWPVFIGGEWYTITTRIQPAEEPIGKATQFVYECLRSTGMQVDYFNWEDQWGRKGRDVVGVIPGAGHPEEIVLLIAHVDSMVSRDVDAEGIYHPSRPAQFLDPISTPMWVSLPAPGADDNASGTAGVLVAASILQKYSFDRTVRFVIVTGEEVGFTGSRPYASAMRQAGEQIAAVYNIDMIAYNHEGGPIMELYIRDPAINPEDMPLATLFTSVISAYQLDLTPTVYFQTIASSRSDHSAFWAEGYPAIHIAEDGTRDFNPYYHSQYERLEHLDMTYFTDIVKAAVGAVAHAAQPLGKTSG